MTVDLCSDEQISKNGKQAVSNNFVGAAFRFRFWSGCSKCYEVEHLEQFGVSWFATGSGGIVVTHMTVSHKAWLAPCFAVRTGHANLL